jgi:hypothetical protein
MTDTPGNGTEHKVFLTLKELDIAAEMACGYAADCIDTPIEDITEQLYRKLAVAYQAAIQAEKGPKDAGD